MPNISIHICTLPGINLFLLRFMIPDEWMAKLVKNPKATLCVPIICTAINFFLPPTGHLIVSDGSVGSGSSVTRFPIALLESVAFLACCWISYVVFVFGLSL